MLRAPTALVTLLLFTLSVSPGLASEPSSTIRVVKKKSAEPEPREEEEAKAAPPPAQPPPAALPSAPPVSPRPAPTAPRPAAVTRAAERPLNLSPQPQAPQPPVVAVEASSTKSPSIVPFVALAGSFVAGVFGVVYAVRTAKLVNDDTMDLELEITSPTAGAKVVVPQEFKDRQSQILSNGLISTLLLSAAVSGTISSIIVLASD